jgi:hypothetical protein
VEVWKEGLIAVVQMIPSSLKFSMEGATPSFADNEGQTVEAGSQVRLRIKGIRSELNQMYAIGSIREDYLGYEEVTCHKQIVSDTDRRPVLSCSSEFRTTASIVSLMLSIGRAALFFIFVTAVYHNLDFSEALEKLVRVEKYKGEDQVCLCFMPIKIPNRKPQPDVERFFNRSITVRAPWPASWNVSGPFAAQFRLELVSVGTACSKQPSSA